MARQLIAVDIDDTLADSTELIRLRVNERYNVDISKEAYRSKGEYWGYYTRVWAEHGLHTLTIQDLDDSMLDEMTRLPLLPSALYAIKEISKQYDVVIITARSQEREAVTRRWIKSTFEGMDIDVHFSSAHRDETAMTKGQICKQLGAKYLIDDNVGHCQSALDEGVSAVLFGEYGWQTGSTTGMVICKDWPAVLDYFNEN